MFTHTLRSASLTALFVGLATAASMHATAGSSRTQYLTFSRPVALPGVALHAGTYVFELAAPEASPDIVRVMSRDRRTVYFTAFTRTVDRPSGVAQTDLVTLGEAAPGEPAPIRVWWSDENEGRQFVYAR